MTLDFVTAKSEWPRFRTSSRPSFPRRHTVIGEHRRIAAASRLVRRDSSSIENARRRDSEVIEDVSQYGESIALTADSTWSGIAVMEVFFGMVLFRTLTPLPYREFIRLSFNISDSFLLRGISDSWRSNH